MAGGLGRSCWFPLEEDALPDVGPEADGAVAGTAAAGGVAAYGHENAVGPMDVETRFM